MKCVFAMAVLLAATTRIASAGGYLGLAIGPEPAVSDNPFLLGPDGRAGRLLGGFRMARFSIEGALTTNDLVAINSDYKNRQLAVSGKLNLPIANDFEAYGRLGLQHTWLTGAVHGDVSGNGYLVALGVEYRLNLALTSASLNLEYGYSDSTLDGDRYAFDFSQRQWMLGFTVGI